MKCDWDTRVFCVVDSRRTGLHLAQNNEMHSRSASQHLAQSESTPWFARAEALALREGVHRCMCSRSASKTLAQRELEINSLGVLALFFSDVDCASFTGMRVDVMFLATRL